VAEVAGIPIVPYSSKHNPELATLLHFAVVCWHTGPFMEFPARSVTYDDWYQPQFRIESGGLVEVPTGLGLGISYDPLI